LNAKKAAILAGYSEDSARSIGSENLTKPAIQAVIYKDFERRANKANVTQDRVIQELKRIAFSNMADFARWDGNTINLKDSDALSRGKTAVIKEISETVTEAGGRTTIKHHDKIKALELIGRHLNMFRDKPDDAPAATEAKADVYPAMTKERAAELLKEKEEKK